MAVPKHPQYEVETVRLSSYTRWPITCNQSPMILCDAGFFYAGFSDCVRCYFCGGGLRNWEDGDIPWIEHARWYPNCDYLKRRKGDLFIQMHRQERDHNPTLQPPPSTLTTGRDSYHDAAKKEMEDAVDMKEEDGIAYKSVLTMGYSKAVINSAIDQLRKRGKTNYTATNIMEIIIEEEEKKEAIKTASTDVLQTPNHAARLPESQSFVASADCQSLLRENHALKEQMICKICLDKDACVVYLPCGHMVTCQACAPTIRKCCICRALILRTVKAYL